jgi:C4-type Zn-finger protein
MLKKVEFCARVAELQAGAAADAEITLEGLLREVEEARKMAMSLNQSSAAVAAIKLKSELSRGHRNPHRISGLDISPPASTI